MSKKKYNLGIRLRGLIIHQFATIEEAFDKEKDEIELSTNLHFRISQPQKVVGVFFKCHFLQDKKPFIILEFVCQFDIEPSAWEGFILTEEEKIVLPKTLLDHLGMITVGTARGVLFAKLENTPFSRLTLPLINVTDMVREDVGFPLEPRKEVTV